MLVVARSVSGAYGRDLFNPLSYNLGIYVLSGLIGSIAIIVAPQGLEINEMVDTWATPSLRLTVVATMFYGFVVLGGTAILFRRFFTQSQMQTKAKYPVLSPITSRMLTVTFLGVILLFSAPRLSFLLSVMTGGIDTWDVMALRAELQEAELGAFFIRRVLVEGLAWIYVLYLVRTGRYRGQLWSLSFGMSLYFLGSLAKVKIVLFLISLFACKFWDRRLSLSLIAKVALVVFLGLIGIWAAFVRNLDPGYLFSLYGEGLVGRILISEISALYPHFAIFGDRQSFLGITSTSNLIASSFGLTSMPRSGRIVLETVSPTWVEAGFGGTFNTVFFGEAFANFAMFGLLLSPFLVVLVYAAVVLGAKLLPYQLRVSFLIHAAINTSAMAGFNDFLWNPFLIVVFVILLIASRIKQYFSYTAKQAT